MAKARKTHSEYGPQGWVIYCPGCKCKHILDSARWTMTGDEDCPTFAPSLLVRCNTPELTGYNPSAKSSVCHSFIRDGRIEFLGDSTHELVGRTVDLPDVPTFG